MYQCPVCAQELIKKQSEFGLFWTCEGCQNWLISLSILRKTIEADFFNRLWQEVRNSGQGQGTDCPLCSKPMNQVFMETTEDPLAFLICKSCNVSWLSPAERAAMPVQPAPVPKAPERPQDEFSSLPPEAAKLLALHQVELIGERAKQEDQFSAAHLPLWQKFLAVVGMPVEDDDGTLRKFPWATVALILTTVVFSVFCFQDFRSPEYYGFVPRDYDRNGGATFLTSFLIHGGWGHLLTNMYFLYVFGRAVEDRIGWMWYLALLVLSTAGGNALTLCFDPASDIPHVGASGGIAGVLLFYTFTFPRNKLVFFMSSYGFMMPRLVRVPAWAALVLWVGLQLFGASFQKAGMSTVSYSSHLGGLLIGLSFWLVLRRFRPSVPAEGLKEAVHSKEG